VTENYSVSRKTGLILPQKKHRAKLRIIFVHSVAIDTAAQKDRRFRKFIARPKISYQGPLTVFLDDQSVISISC
jgi:hypothetical protein